MSDLNISIFSNSLNDSQIIDDMKLLTYLNKENKESDNNYSINYFEEKITKDMTDLDQKNDYKENKKEYNNIKHDNFFIDIKQGLNLLETQRDLNESKEKKILGRKRKNESDDKAKHNRFSDDNSRRKIKRIIISKLHEFINKKIEEKYDGNIGEGMNKKKLMKLCQDQISNASVKFNQEFLFKSLEEIFSEKISGRITNYTEDRNKEIVFELINEPNTEISNYFKGLFKLNFKTCLEYFRDEIDNEYLEGFIKFKELKNEYIEAEGKDYIDHIEVYLKNYEKILKNKKPRK